MTLCCRSLVVLEPSQPGIKDTDLRNKEVDGRDKPRRERWDMLVKMFDVRKDALEEMSDANVLSVATSMIIDRT